MQRTGMEVQGRSGGCWQGTHHHHSGTLQCAGKVGERRRRGKEMMREYGKGNPVTNSLGWKKWRKRATFERFCPKNELAVNNCGSFPPPPSCSFFLQALPWFSLSITLEKKVLTIAGKWVLINLEHSPPIAIIGCCRRGWRTFSPDKLLIKDGKKEREKPREL